MGFAAGQIFLALPYYSQRTVFASPLSAFSFTLFLLDQFLRLTVDILILGVSSASEAC